MFAPICEEGATEDQTDSRAAMDAEDILAEEQASIDGANVGAGEPLNLDRMGEQVIVAVNAEGRVGAILDEFADNGSPCAS